MIVPCPGLAVPRLACLFRALPVPRLSSRLSAPQGYWPTGLYTPPSDAASLSDIVAAKRLGFDLLRKHAKVEPARWYYHADRVGMLVWQDMPSPPAITCASGADGDPLWPPEDAVVPEEGEEEVGFKPPPDTRPACVLDRRGFGLELREMVRRAGRDRLDWPHYC